MELSERLKAQKRHLQPYGDDTASSMMRLNTEEINAIIAALDSSEHNAKCVQFAEDVERLGEVMFYWFSENPPEDRWQIQFNYCGKICSAHGMDQFTAARKAAEELRAAKEGA